MALAEEPTSTLATLVPPVSATHFVPSRALFRANSEQIDEHGTRARTSKGDIHFGRS